MLSSVSSYQQLEQLLKEHQQIILLLYKASGDSGQCAYRSLEALSGNGTASFLAAAKLEEVHDIHPHFGITTAPSYLVFENGRLSHVVKGCQDVQYLKSLADSSFALNGNNAGEAPQKRVTVYSTPTCTWCNTLKRWLQENNIRYSEIDVTKNQSAAEEMVRRSGQQGVPQTDINGQMVVGFDQQKLRSLLLN